LADLLIRTLKTADIAYLNNNYLYSQEWKDWTIHVQVAPTFAYNLNYQPYASNPDQAFHLGRNFLKNTRRGVSFYYYFSFGCIVTRLVLFI
jgi:hypothetical protein